MGWASVLIYTKMSWFETITDMTHFLGAVVEKVLRGHQDLFSRSAKPRAYPSMTSAYVAGLAMSPGS